MFELPELVNLAAQINRTIRGKQIRNGCLGDKPHKFVWYNRTHEEFSRLVPLRKIGETYTRGKWLFIPLEPGYVLVFGEFGGRLLYHHAGSSLPRTYHLWLTFDDNSSLTATTQMWGVMELFEKGQELERKYIKDMRPTPTESEFTFAYFSNLIGNLPPGEKRSVKGLLTQDQLIPGLGNSIAQDIMFRAKLHPKHLISDLSTHQQRALYEAILSTLETAIRAGGRADEHGFDDQPGGYIRLMDKQSVGNPCPVCGDKVEKIQYLGGACYFCPKCQR